MAHFGDAKGEYRGLIYRSDAALAEWLARKPPEAVLEPDLPIIDPHHHLWDTPQRGLYFLPELLKDIGGGHNVVSTVFLECHAMYRKDGPVELAPVGEIEFVRGIAAQMASGNYGTCRVAEGIVGWADLMLGARVRETLEAQIAAGGGRFRGIRHGLAWDGHESVGKFASRYVEPDRQRNPTFREGLAQLAKLNLSFESWQYHPQLPGAIELAASTSSDPSGSRAIRSRAGVSSTPRASHDACMRALARGSTPIGTPKALAILSAVMSSWVGPMPPVVNT